MYTQHNGQLGVVEEFRHIQFAILFSLEL